MVRVGWGNALWQLIASSDFLTALILLILLALSVISWAIFFYKVVFFIIKKRHMKTALKLISNAESFDDLRTKVGMFSHSLPGYFVLQNLAYLKKILESLHDRSRLDEREFELVEYNLEQTIDNVILEEERFLPFLSTTYQIGTLLGLLGTVWGLIYAFLRISERQSADIASIAPGIAAALITTLAGLLVAIPAKLMYDYLTLQVHSLEHQLEQIADRFRWLVQVAFFKRPSS